MREPERATEGMGNGGVFARSPLRYENGEQSLESPPDHP